MIEASATVAARPFSRTNPFPARMLVNRRLSGPESEKDTRHLELDLTGWGLSFEVGDSVGVYPTNDPDLVDEIIRALGATGMNKRLDSKESQQHCEMRYCAITASPNQRRNF